MTFIDPRSPTSAQDEQTTAIHFLNPFRYVDNAFNTQHTLAIRGQATTSKYDRGTHFYVLGGTETSGVGSSYFTLVTDVTIGGGSNIYASSVY